MLDMEIVHTSLLPLRALGKRFSSLFLLLVAPSKLWHALVGSHVTPTPPLSSRGHLPREPVSCPLPIRIPVTGLKHPPNPEEPHLN